MKNTKKLLSIIAFAFAMLILSNPAMVHAESNGYMINIGTKKKDFSVTEIGKITKKAEVEACGNAFKAVSSEGSYLVSEKGERISEVYSNIEKLTNEYYMVSTKVTDIKDVNKTGIISSTGEIVLKQEAFLIEKLNNEGTNHPSDRYVKVFYATEKTDDEDECIVYATDDIVSMFPDATDMMFKGYYKVFDLKNRRFVGGNELVMERDEYVEVTGNLVNHCDKNGIKKVYDDKNQLLFEVKDDINILSQFSNNMFVTRNIQDNTQTLYDETGKKIISSDEGNINIISGDKLIYEIESESKKEIYDIEGKKLLEESFDRVDSCYDGVLEICDDNSKYQLVNLESGKILEESESELPPNYIGYGYWGCQKENGNDIFTKEGKIGEFSNIHGSSLVFTNKNGNREDAYIIDANDYSVNVSNGFISVPGDDVLGMILVYDYDADKKSSLISSFTGKKLIEDADTITVSGNKICALNDNTYTLYTFKKPEE